MNAKNVTYFDSFGVEHIPKEIRKFIGSKNVKTNICNKYRKCKDTIWKTLSLSIVYSKCGHEFGKIFKEEESLEIVII